MFIVRAPMLPCSGAAHRLIRLSRCRAPRAMPWESAWPGVCGADLNLKRDDIAGAHEVARHFKEFDSMIMLGLPALRASSTRHLSRFTCRAATSAAIDD